MKTGLKIAAFVLAAVLSPRVASADAFLVHRTGPPLAAPAARSSTSPGRQPGRAPGKEMAAGHHEGTGHGDGIPKRSWALPRRRKLTTRALTDGRRAAATSAARSGAYGAGTPAVQREMGKGEPAGRPQPTGR